MNSSLESDSSKHNRGDDQAQGRVPNLNKKDDNLDSWIDNFLFETGDLKEKGGGESSDTKLTSGEDVSAWADRILSGGSPDEEKGDGSQGHLNDGESDDPGNTLAFIPSTPHRSSKSAISKIISCSDDDDGDQTKGDESESGDHGIGNAQNSSSAILATVNSDDDDDSDNGENGEALEPSPYLPFHNEGDDFGIGTEGESGSVQNPHGDPVFIPSPLNGTAKSSSAISMSSDDYDGDGLTKQDGTEEEILESTPILAFDNDDDSSGTEIASNESNGESDSREDTQNELGPGTSSPLNLKKRSSTLITIIGEDDDEPALSHEPKGESLKPTPVKPAENENDSPGMEIAGCKTGGESGNNGDAQNEHGPGTIPPQRNHRKQSSTTITVDDEEQAEQPGRQNRPTSVEPGLNEDDQSRMGINGNTSDWDEIDLNSENEDHDDNTSTSTGGVAPSGGQTGGSIKGSTDPILPEGNTSGSVSRDQTYASYFKMYFNFIYHLRISPYNGDGRNPCGIWNYVPFAMIFLVALLQTAMSIKDVIFYDVTEDILLHLSRIGYESNVLLFRFYITYLVIFKSASILGIIKAAEECGGHPSKLEVFSSTGSSFFISLLLAVTFPFVLITTRMLGKWDYEDLTLVASEEFAETWLIWSKETFKNDTEYVWDAYGTDISTTVVLLAISNFAFGIIGFASLYLIKDYSLVAALTMYKLCNKHSKDVDQFRSSTITQENCQQLWERYKLIRTFSDRLNDSCGFLFQLFHLDNLMFSAYLLSLQLTSGGSLLIAILQLCVLAKVIIFYLLAANSASINGELDKWAQTSFPGPNTLIMENGEFLTTSNLLHQIEKNPIGIGRGIFFIDGTFLWKFTSVVGSLFIFLTQNRQ